MVQHYATKIDDIASHEMFSLYRNSTYANNLNTIDSVYTIFLADLLSINVRNTKFW